MDLSWSAQKDADVRSRYGVGFENVVEAIANGGLLAIRAHPNKVRYPHQRQLIVEIDGYVWVVPCVFSGDAGFMKTMFPSRRATREYLGAQDEAADGNDH